MDVEAVFTPSGIRATTAAGATVLDAARVGGVDLDSVCGGRGLCGRCQVSVGDPAALSAVGPTEEAYRGRRRIMQGHRLGCQARLLASAVIDVPASSQVHRPVVRKTIDLGEIEVHPLVTLHYVELPEAVLGSETTETQRISQALAADWGLHSVEFDPGVLASLGPAAAAGNDTVTVVLHDRRQVLAVRSGYSDGAWGVAVDVGSTTVAGYLVDLSSGEITATAGRMNPQIRFGEDLMSRVSYAMMNPDGDAELTAAVRQAIDDLVSELCEQAGEGVDRSKVHDLVVVGNPIMHHLVLGIDPTPLGAAPFMLTTADAVQGQAVDIGVDLAGSALYVGPCIAGHVGADAAAAALAEGPHRAEESMLVVDVGTNAEIVLGDGKRVLAASSPTGPAFEGAQISCGQRATAGAVERLRIDRTTWAPRFKVIGCDLWSDEAGFDEALDEAGLEVSGLCGSGIIEVIAEMYLCGIIDRHGAIRPAREATREPRRDHSDTEGSRDTASTDHGDTSDAMRSRSERIEADGRTYRYVIARSPIALAITQNDVRAIQLAKAALRAGIDLLRERAGVFEIGDVRLAGAFGTHIDPVRAMVLGLVPDTPPGGVRAVGNASGVGAVRMLLSAEQRREAQDMARAVLKIETATEARFQELFVAAMALPHDVEPTPHLAAMIALPEHEEDLHAAPQRRRRSSRRAATMQA